MKKLVKPKLSEHDKMQLKETFDLFDNDGTGRIEPRVTIFIQELKEAMASLGFDLKSP